MSHSQDFLAETGLPGFSPGDPLKALNDETASSLPSPPLPPTASWPSVDRGVARQRVGVIGAGGSPAAHILPYFDQNTLIHTI